MALVADYGSDESSITDSDEEVQYDRTQPTVTDVPKQQNFFTTEENEDSSGSDDERTEKQAESAQSEKLPNPLVMRMSETEKVDTDVVKHDKAAGSVFINPYRQAEVAKDSVLEQHVKMVEKKFIKGKAGQICFKFKRGRCPFGKSCKYSHDLSSEMISTQPTKTNEGSSSQTRPWIDFNNSVVCQPLEPELEDDDGYMSQAKRKKRAGVNDNLQPPKRALQTLEKQRETERPWTMKKK